MTDSRKPLVLSAGALAGGLLLAGAAFSATPLAQGYLLGAQDAAPAATGKEAGEGKCGMAHMDSDKDGRVSKAEFAAAHDNDDAKFAGHDGDGDGFISEAEMKSHMADRPAAKKAGMEGKCGEGKCGGAA